MKSLLHKLRLPRWLAGLMTISLIGVVLFSADARQVAATLRTLDWGWLALGLAAFLPLTVGAALRWRAMVGPWRCITLREACRQVLASSALNLFAPSKLGDFGKAGFLLQDGRDVGEPLAAARASGLVLVEKVLDLAALLCWFAVAVSPFWGAVLVVGVFGGLFVVERLAMPGMGRLDGDRRSDAGGHPTFGPPCIHGGLNGALAGVSADVITWHGCHAHARVGMFARLIASFTNTLACPSRYLAASLGLWVIHLAQIATFFCACRLDLPLTTICQHVPIAIVAGLVPWTIAGIGARDSALLVLFPDHPAVAVVGLLTALRYLVPGALGIPALHRYLRSACAAPLVLTEAPSARVEFTLDASDDTFETTPDKHASVRLTGEVELLAGSRR